MKTDTCRSCQAEVIFVKTARGATQILDAVSVKGVVLQVPGCEAYAGPVHLIDDDVVSRVVDVYTDHHVTCPKAAEWKGKRR